MNLRGRVHVVTGANSGIGREVPTFSGECEGLEQLPVTSVRAVGFWVDLILEMDGHWIILDCCTVYNSVHVWRER